MFNNSNNLSVKQLHVKSNLVPLNDIRNVHILQCMFQRALKTKYVDNRNLLTRAHGKKLLLVNMPRTEKYKKSVAYKGAIAWNNLSLEAQTAESYEAFKLKCKKMPAIMGLVLEWTPYCERSTEITPPWTKFKFSTSAVLFYF